MLSDGIDCVGDTVKVTKKDLKILGKSQGIRNHISMALAIILMMILMNLLNPLMITLEMFCLKRSY